MYFRYNPGVVVRVLRQLQGGGRQANGVGEVGESGQARRGGWHGRVDSGAGPRSPRCLRPGPLNDPPAGERCRLPQRAFIPGIILVKLLKTKNKTFSCKIEDFCVEYHILQAACVPYFDRRAYCGFCMTSAAAALALGTDLPWGGGGRYSPSRHGLLPYTVRLNVVARP